MDHDSDGKGSTDRIRDIEEFTLNAWPALRQVLLDGWVLRFADGYTGRSNSVNPLYPGTVDPTEKVRLCERFYWDAGLPAVFKLTPDSAPADLERLLVDRGYREGAGASVQLCDLAAVDGSAEDLPGSPESLRIWDDPADEWDEWLNAYTTTKGVEPRHRETLRAIIDAIVPRRRLLAVVEDGQIVACGLGVAQPPWLGLFDIITRPDRRNRGIGRRLVLSLMAWGRESGATTACLQVMTGNAAAWALYAKLGFREAYQYRYLVRRP